MNNENPTADNMMEVISRLTSFLFNTFFIRKIASIKVMTTRGSSTQCSERQSSISMTIPEIDGAEAGATFVTAPSIPMANPRRRYGNTINSNVWTSGSMIPAPIAWMTLERIRMPKFGDHPPMIVPISIQDMAKTTSALEENVVDK